MMRYGLVFYGWLAVSIWLAFRTVLRFWITRPEWRWKARRNWRGYCMALGAEVLFSGLLTLERWWYVIPLFVGGLLILIQRQELSWLKTQVGALELINAALRDENESYSDLLDEEDAEDDDAGWP